MNQNIRYLIEMGIPVDVASDALKRFNDNLEDAKALVKLLKGMLCHVNLIPINKIENRQICKKY